MTEKAYNLQIGLCASPLSLHREFNDFLIILSQWENFVYRDDLDIQDFMK